MTDTEQSQSQPKPFDREARQKRVDELKAQREARQKAVRETWQNSLNRLKGMAEAGINGILTPKATVETMIHETVLKTDDAVNWVKTESANRQAQASETLGRNLNNISHLAQAGVEGARGWLISAGGGLVERFIDRSHAKQARLEAKMAKLAAELQKEKEHQGELGDLGRQGREASKSWYDDAAGHLKNVTWFKERRKPDQTNQQ